MPTRHVTASAGETGPSDESEDDLLDSVTAGWGSHLNRSLTTSKWSTFPPLLLLASTGINANSSPTMQSCRATRISQDAFSHPCSSPIAISDLIYVAGMGTLGTG